MKLPEHKCGLYLEHNTYRDIYQSIVTAVEEQDPHWVSETERARALATSEIWSLQWYPNTPVGFHKVVASTLQACLEFTNAR